MVLARLARRVVFRGASPRGFSHLLKDRPPRLALKRIRKMEIEITVRVKDGKEPVAAESFHTALEWDGSPKKAARFILAEIAEKFPQHHRADSAD
jgi:hypothetical protein